MGGNGTRLDSVGATMSKTLTIETAVEADGIVCAVLQGPALDLTAKADGCPDVIPEAAGRLLGMFDVVPTTAMLGNPKGDPPIRAIIGEHTVHAARDGDYCVAVATVTAHPVVKSVRRLMRRLIRNAKNTKPAAPRTPKGWL